MLLRLIAIALISTLAACGGDKGGDATDGTNSYAVRKASIDAYMKAVEAAPDADAALTAGQAWIDANMAAYKKNCVQWQKDSGDLSKGDLAKGNETNLQEYIARLHKVAGHDPAKMDMKKLKKSALLQKQLNSFWLCDNALKAP